MALLSPLLRCPSSSELLLPLCRSISCSDEFKPLVGVSGFVASCGRLRDAIFVIYSSFELSETKKKEEKKRMRISENRSNVRRYQDASEARPKAATNSHLTAIKFDSKLKNFLIVLQF